MHDRMALTERERTILEMLATSLTHSGIARELHLSLNTVKSHVSHIYTKLDVGSRDEAIETARAAGLLAGGAAYAGREVPFEALVTHSRGVITIVDAERRLLWADKSFRELLGEPPEVRFGRPVWEIVHPDDRARLGKLFAEVSARPGASVTFECRVAHADGTWRYVEVHQVNRLHDPAVNGFVGTTRQLPNEVA